MSAFDAKPTRIGRMADHAGSALSGAMGWEIGHLLYPASPSWGFVGMLAALVVVCCVVANIRWATPPAPEGTP